MITYVLAVFHKIFLALEAVAVLVLADTWAIVIQELGNDFS